MLYCKKCKVTIRTAHKECPLCQGTLTGEAKEEEQVFPEIDERPYASKKIIRWFNFCCIALSIICVVINWIWTPETWWSLFAIAGFVCVWVFLAVGLYKRKNLMKNAMWQLILISVGAVIWDVVIGWTGWSVDYVLPIACMLTMASMVLITMIRHLESPEYMIYFLMNGIYGIIPLILLLVGCVKAKMLSILCVGCCALFLSALFIFQGRAVWNELQKKFHF